MTDAPAPSLLDRVKAAMGTYETQRSDNIQFLRFGVRRRDDREYVAQELLPDQAREHALDLNARAVIDAIAGALTWDDRRCYIGYVYVGSAWHTPRAERGPAPWRAWVMIDDDDGREVGWFATELEARAAVEQAFKAALTDHQPKEKQA